MYAIRSYYDPGQRFDKELLDEERQRIEESLRNKGFYKFSREFIFYTATELAAGNLVRITSYNVCYTKLLRSHPQSCSKLRYFPFSYNFV